ncbi:hypothetical protein ROHU_027989 [Labeo rohita]|uniref:Uncharacterized protein n=1 Tax=Labeo rohita TaxID=84645 RepID=A0A498M4Y9_LABRO|nr:hypothetical protein ROHU_027989 [Labeo rohita]
MLDPAEQMKSSQEYAEMLDKHRSSSSVRFVSVRDLHKPLEREKTNFFAAAPAMCRISIPHHGSAFGPVH